MFNPEVFRIFFQSSYRDFQLFLSEFLRIVPEISTRKGPSQDFTKCTPEISSSGFPGIAGRVSREILSRELSKVSPKLSQKLSGHFS